MGKTTAYPPPLIWAPLLAVLLVLLSACATSPESELDALRGTVEALSAENAQQASALATQAFWIQYLATRPPIIVTPAGPGIDPTPYRPVMGRVTLGYGRCCVGGPAGEALQITIDLDATSPLAEVTEMRLAVGSHFLSEEEMAGVPWEPFARQKVDIISNVPTNWSGRYASVQFRDAAGNLSPVFHDDISVEGEAE